MTRERAGAVYHVEVRSALPEREDVDRLICDVKPDRSIGQERPESQGGIPPVAPSPARR